MEYILGVLVFFALTDFSLSILAIFSIATWAKDLNKRVTKLEQENEKTD